MALSEGRAARVEGRRCARLTEKQQRSTTPVLTEGEMVNELEDENSPRIEVSENDSVVVSSFEVMDVGCEVEVQCEFDSVVTAVSAESAAEATKSNVKSVSVACQTMFKSAFSIEKLKDGPESVHYYTGLEIYEKLMLVLHSLGPAVEELNYRYSVVENICVEDQFLMTLIKLRRAEPDFGLARMFDVSRKTVQNIVVTWINFMFHEWSDLNLWPSKDLVRYYMPYGIQKHYPSTRAIIDGTEIPIAAPSKPLLQQAAFSTYKNRTTVKALIGSTPGGLILSPGSAGSTSDRAVVERSDLFTKCDPGHTIMADRGFTVQDLFAPYHVTINMPTILKGRSQLPGLTLLKDRKLATKRVHIERIIDLAKTYKIMKNELPAYYVPLASEIIYICCVLCNFRENIVGKNA